ncbi:nuclear transport factor 2 family protein, partial [Acinetobacter baumannii]
MQNEQGVTATEERLRAAMISEDVQALSELIDENLVFTGPMGKVMTKEEDLEAHRKRRLQIRRRELFETTLHPFHDIVVT